MLYSADKQTAISKKLQTADMQAVSSSKQQRSTQQLQSADRRAVEEYIAEELGSNAHVEVHAEVEVSRDERLGCRSTGDDVHHRSLHLQHITKMYLTSQSRTSGRQVH